jgi:hypothetical protein
MFIIIIIIIHHELGLDRPVSTSEYHIPTNALTIYNNILV